MRDVNAKQGEVGTPEDAEVLTILEETATIAKRRVSSGKVVVRTILETEEQLLREELTGERVDVERVPMDRVIDGLPEVRTEGNVTIISIVEERLVVKRQLVLVEEVRLDRHATTETVELPVTLRKQRAVVEHVDAESSPIADPKEQSR